MNTLSVVILNYNSSQDTLFLHNQIEGYHPLLDVVVVDNASELQEQKILRDNLPKDQVIFNKTNLGFAAGNKIGINRALKRGFQYCLLLNPDIRLKNDTIPGLLKSIHQDKKIAVIGPRICYRVNPEVIYSDGGLVRPEEGYSTAHQNTNRKVQDIDLSVPLVSADYINGSVFLFRLSILDIVGPMRDDFFLYFEETEWCMRCSAAGLKLMVNTDFVAYHQSSEKSGVYHYYMARNRILLSKLMKKYKCITISKELKRILISIKTDLKVHKTIKHNSIKSIKGFIYGVLGV